MQLFGDLEDLKKKFDYPEKDDVPKKSSSHCSAIVKILPSQTDILFSHVTWTTYSSMLRMQKRYSFPIGEPGRTIAFSGYPGLFSSLPRMSPFRSGNLDRRLYCDLGQAGHPGDDN